MIDPVSGFEYPVAWVEACPSPDDLRAVEAGFAVLTAGGRVLRRGFTTGTTAAAAAKASVLSLSGISPGWVDILTPAGIQVRVKVTGREGAGECRKFAGDYPGDVTAGMRFLAHSMVAESGILITTGSGIGIWRRENPRYPRGTPAISPPALGEIQGAIEEALAITGLPGVRVEISAPDGEKIAEKTLNAKIGVFGGISVLGSTGFVEPWDDHLEESCITRVGESDRVVLTTGRVGLRYSRLLFPDHETILVGSRLGAALDHLRGEGIICGLPALILKFIMPEFLDGTGFGSVEEMIGDPCFTPRAKDAISGFGARYPGIRIVLLDRTGHIILEGP